MEEPLDYEAIVDGMILCSKNANQLAKDASVMMMFRRHPTAGLLAITSLEEAGKVFHLEFILGYLLTGKTDDIRWKEFWKVWRDHTPKFFAGTIKGLDYTECYDSIIEILSLEESDFRTFRNRLMYVDRTSDGWVTPTDMEKARIAGLVKMAKAYSRELVKDNNPTNRDLIIPEIRELAQDTSHIQRIIEKINIIDKALIDAGVVANTMSSQGI
jgi:AbiV family abortive infection protein